MVDSKSINKITNKDIAKLEKEYARCKVYIAGIVKEQQAISKKAQEKVAEVNNELKKLKKQLHGYTTNKELDEDFYKLKVQYERLLITRNSLQQTIIVAEESIAEAQLSYISSDL